MEATDEKGAALMDVIFLGKGKAKQDEGKGKGKSYTKGHDKGQG